MQNIQPHQSKLNGLKNNAQNIISKLEIKSSADKVQGCVEYKDTVPIKQRRLLIFLKTWLQELRTHL